MRVTSIRIGNFADQPVDQRRLSIWLKPEDLLQLIRIGLEHPDIRCQIFFGASDNARGWWDNEEAFRFGYRPTGVAEKFRDAALAAQAKIAPDRVADWYEGGPFCSDGYDGDEDLWLR
jgi:uronate dehydrogenase